MIVALIAMGYKAEKYIYVFFFLSRSNGYRFYHNIKINKQNLVLCINDIYVHVSLNRWNHIASDWSNKFIWYLRKTYFYRIKPHSIHIPSHSVQNVCLLQHLFFVLTDLLVLQMSHLSINHKKNDCYLWSNK